VLNASCQASCGAKCDKTGQRLYATYWRNPTFLENSSELYDYSLFTLNLLTIVVFGVMQFIPATQIETSAGSGFPVGDFACTKYMQSTW